MELADEVIPDNVFFCKIDSDVPLAMIGTIGFQCIIMSSLVLVVFILRDDRSVMRTLCITVSLSLYTALNDNGHCCVASDFALQCFCNELTAVATRSPSKGRKKRMALGGTWCTSLINRTHCNFPRVSTSTNCGFSYSYVPLPV